MSQKAKNRLRKFKKYAREILKEQPKTKLRKIYILEVEEKKSIKVGETDGCVEKRNAQTMTNASLRRKKGTSAWWVSAYKYDDTRFTDTDFIKYLLEKGYVFERNNNDNRSEWVEFDPEGKRVTSNQIKDELNKFMGRPVYDPLVLRAAQRYAIDEIQKLIDLNCKYINAGLCVRLGKTIVSLEIAARNNFMFVHIGKNLTSQTSAKIDNGIFGIVPDSDLLTVSIHGENGEGKSKKIIDKIEAENGKNLPVLFVIDEVDDASHTKNSISTIKPIVEHFKSNGNLGCVITMSGTRIHRGEKVLNEISEDGFEEVLLHYHEMQMLQPEVTCDRNFIRICCYDESNPAGLLNISDSLKCKTGREDLVELVKSILGDNNFEIESNDEFPHWFVKICANKLDDVGRLIKLLNKNCSVIGGQEYVYFAINGTTTKNKTAQRDCQNLIQKNKGKICVFISQGMATTSFSVKGIGNSLVLTDNKLTADDIQALHRSATWAEGKDECNMVVVTTNGDEQHKYDDIFENETKSDNPEDQKIKYKSVLNNNSITHIITNGITNGSSKHSVKIESKNVADYIDKKQKAMKSVNSLVSAIYGEDVDPKLREWIVTNAKGLISKSKKFKSGKPDSIESDSNHKDNKEYPKEKSGKISKKEIEITRQFVKGSINLPAIAKEQGIGIRDLSNLNANLGVDLELFFDVYDSVEGFKYGIDLIYRDCDDRTYLRECIDRTMFRNDFIDTLMS